MKPTGLKHPLKSQIQHFHTTGRRVFIRIDGDIPLKNGTILDDTRLQQALPTLELIKQKRGKIILATHIGRPKDKEPELSTRVLIPWFLKHGFSVTFAPNLDQAQELSHNTSSDIILLENLRFNKEEQKPDVSFANKLAKLGDFYINEAFGTSHRQDTSLTLVPQQFGPEERTIGLHCQKEIQTLLQIQHNPKRPLVFILGGGKVEDKLLYLINLIKIADCILLCPALACTLMKAQDKEVGKSLVADTALPIAKHILEAPHATTKLIFPIDYQVASKTIDGPLSIINADAFTEDMIGIAIGPKTIDEYIDIINKAGTVFFNGPMGFKERPETMQASCALLKAMAHAHAYTAVAGGDSVAAAYSCNVASTIHHLSAGGGAALAFLSGNNLPGLTLFM